MSTVILRHDPKYIPPLPWKFFTDEICISLVKHFFLLESAGWTMHWCCGLDKAVQNRDIREVRHWMFMHEYVVRIAMQYQVERYK
jgi:hypothetical protein